MKILVKSDGETLRYAAEELKKYITAMSDGEIFCEIALDTEASVRSLSGRIILGELSALGLPCDDLTDPIVEDIVDVEINGLSGYIGGSNERSVLMGVYRYCESLGVRYIRPGEDGDYIPSADPTSHSFKYRKKADYPFRGQCCEGAISYEDMRDTVYFLPKIGMNMYMIEGLVPYTYMHKWYGHVYNTKLRIPGQVTEYKMLEKYIGRLERDVKRAGLQLHTLGHAWMFEKMGIHHAGTAETRLAEKNLPDEHRRLLAEVKGKRGIFADSTFFTHFCYSNPDARRMLVDYLVEYAERKPHVDFIHAWLADAVNNHCECPECCKREPSDWYVILLNELDERLSAIGSQAKIVFIMYNDTIRPPITERLKNTGRFILLSAMGGFYEEGYKREECNEALPPFERNNFKAFSAPLRMKCHRDWKAECDGITSMIYEYRYYVDMYCDISGMRVAAETYRDMKALESVDFNGCMSDQTHRMYMPTALPMVAMGNTLFDRDTDYTALSEEYFKGAFGEDAEKVREYLESMSVLLSPANFRVGGEGGIEEEGVGFTDTTSRSWKNNPFVLERARKLPELLDSFLPVIERNLKAAVEPARRESWRYLGIHSDICRYHGRILEAGAEGDDDRAKAVFAELRDFLSERELEYHRVFDLFLYLRAVAQKIRVPLPGYYD